MVSTHSFLSQADVPSSSQQGLQEPKNQGLGVKSKIKKYIPVSLSPPEFEAHHFSDCTASFWAHFWVFVALEFPCFWISPLF